MRISNQIDNDISLLPSSIARNTSIPPADLPVISNLKDEEVHAYASKFLFKYPGSRDANLKLYQSVFKQLESSPR